MIKYLAEARRNKTGTSTQRYVFLALASRVTSDGICWPKHEKIQEDTGLSMGAIIRAIKALEATGRITVKRAPPKVNYYKLNILTKPTANSIQSDSIQSDSIQSDSIQSDSIQSDSIQSDSIQSDSIQSDSITVSDQVPLTVSDQIPKEPIEEPIEEPAIVTREDEAETEQEPNAAPTPKTGSSYQNREQVPVLQLDPEPVTKPEPKKRAPRKKVNIRPKDEADFREQATQANTKPDNSKYLGDAELEKFILHYTEQDDYGKMKCQILKTWSMRGRLATWAGNASRFSQKSGVSNNRKFTGYLPPDPDSQWKDYF